MKNWKIELNEAIKQVHQYYPVGLLHFEEAYDGFKECKLLVEKKINELITDIDSEWKNLSKTLEQEHGKQIQILSAQQFPSYIAKIVIDNQKSEFFEYHRCLVVNVSLLWNRYTLFFEDNYIFYYNNLKRLVAPQKKIIFFEEHEFSGQKKIVETTKRDVEAQFLNHSYIHHQFLFERKVKDSVPYNTGHEFAKDEYSLYQLLFDGFFDDQYSDILK